MKRLNKVIEAAEKVLKEKADASDAIRDMFNSNQYRDGVVPDSDIQVILKSDRWRRMYGDVKKAWAGLVKDGYVKKNGHDWEWVG